MDGQRSQRLSTGDMSRYSRTYSHHGGWESWTRGCMPDNETQKEGTSPFVLILLQQAFPFTMAGYVLKPHCFQISCLVVGLLISWTGTVVPNRRGQMYSPLFLQVGGRLIVCDGNCNELCQGCFEFSHTMIQNHIAYQRHTRACVS